MEKGVHRSHHGGGARGHRGHHGEGGASRSSFGGGSLTLLASAEVWDCEHGGCLLWG